MDQKEKNKGYRWLAIGVGVIALLATGAYVYKFWGWPPSASDKTQDWANFATYISGTVGVAAVVATLMAFVITLRQQKRLIDSQDEMIEKQEQQLDLARQQLDGEERRRKVELAYNCAVNIIPPVVKELERQRALPLERYFNKLDLIGDIPFEVDLFETVGDMFKDEGSYQWLIEMDRGWGACIGQCLTASAYRLGVLVSDCLHEARELEDYFRSIIGSDNFRVIECAMLFKKNSVNSGFSRHQIVLRIVDGQQSNPVAQFWHDLGERVFEKPAE
ncbi:hypothetical protein [Vreelandella neptunia]|uniref:hypothetical protein n=1 Tax=Vreelandella neptunia TaxID=115551 RepID=UPI003159CCEE